MGCGILQKKEHVVLFDGGLRIESSGRVLYKNRWKKRYVVCQRRNGSEAPLIGLFKNDKAREKGQHLELFYMQNYIGYEYGEQLPINLINQHNFRISCWSNNKNLGFTDGESYEWLRDICGRSLIYCMHVNNMPRTAILQLSGNDVRIHLTKTMLVVVQSSPPTQLACLNLRNLNRVECAEGELTFEANARSWLKHHTFSFTGEHTVQISRALRLLLRPDQFLSSGSQTHPDSFQMNNPVLSQPQMMHDITSQSQHPSGQQPQHLDFATSSMPMLPHPLRSHTPTIATTPAQTLPLPPRRRWMNENQWSNLHHYVNTRITEPNERHKLLTQEHSVLYTNQSNAQSLASLMQQSSMASALTMPRQFSEIETFDERQYHNLNIVNARIAANWNSFVPPPVPPKLKVKEIETDDNTSPSSQPSLAAQSTPSLDPNQFESDSNHEHVEVHQLVTAPTNSNTIGNKPGLVKPYVPDSLMKPNRNVGMNLSKRLMDKVTGSFEVCICINFNQTLYLQQYDGDRSTNTDENSEMFANLLSSIPVAEAMRRRLSTVDNTHFNLSSSSRIDHAVQKRREHLKQRDKRLSQMGNDKIKISSSGSSLSSAYQTLRSPVGISVTPTGSANTLMNSHQQSSQDDRESCKTTIYQERKLGIGHETTNTQSAIIDELESEAESTIEGSPRTRGISTVSLPVSMQPQPPPQHPIFHLSGANGSLASIQSELNDRILFERGGHARRSGRSIGKNAEKRPHPSSLNYVAIDSSTNWLHGYRKNET
ncbi:hypothetical protein M3Y94_00323300 [Aphelenchoides besseyi]|nr:hypothetical protein M3Y94_00323300 [Aphelenchoides besseyi]